MWENVPIGVIKLPLFTSNGNQEFTSCLYKTTGLFLVFIFVMFGYFTLQQYGTIDSVLADRQ